MYVEYLLCTVSLWLLIWSCEEVFLCLLMLWIWSCEEVLMHWHDGLGSSGCR